MTTTPVFQRSSRCSSGGCVEVAHRPSGTVVVRSSEDPDRVLTFTPSEWQDFLAGVHADDFD